MNNEEKILELLSDLREDVSSLKGKMEDLDQRSIRMETRMDQMETRMDRMEIRMDQTQSLLKEVDQRSIRTQVLLETEFSDRLQLLYDGHVAIVEKLDSFTPKSRMEVLEGDVSMLKDVVKLMRLEITELKKAQ